jgi:hypothetical protein
MSIALPMKSDGRDELGDFYILESQLREGEASDIKRPKELEHENRMLQQLYTHLSFGEYGIEGCNRNKSSNACRTVSGRSEGAPEIRTV